MLGNLRLVGVAVYTYSRVREARIDVNGEFGDVEIEKNFIWNSDGAGGGG